MGDVDGCTTMWMYLVPLNYTLKNSEYSELYVMYIFPQLKWIGGKKRKWVQISGHKQSRNNALDS